MMDNHAYNKLLDRKNALLDKIAPHFHAYRANQITLAEYSRRVKSDVHCLQQVVNLIALFESKMEVSGD